MSFAEVDPVPMVSRPKYRRSVGELSVQNLGRDRLCSEIFVVVNLLNDIEPQMLDRESKLQMAGLNHEASARAATVSAFDSAARYAKRGIEFLGDDTLASDTYDVSLGLLTIGAKSERAMGNVETLEQYCMMVIKRDDIPLEDKFGGFTMLGSTICLTRISPRPSRCVLKSCRISTVISQRTWRKAPQSC